MQQHVHMEHARLTLQLAVYRLYTMSHRQHLAVHPRNLCSVLVLNDAALELLRHDATQAAM